MSLSLLRSILFNAPCIALATILYGTVSLLCSVFDSSGRTQHSVARAWSRMLLRIAGVRATVQGLENILPGGSYVFASNHLSYMDTPVVLAFIPVQFRFLAKQSLFRIPFLGHHLHRAGHISVPREDARGSVRVMTEAARMLRERGVSILVFPEGGRTAGELREFKEGGSYIAIKAGVPIVPVAIRGSRAVLPMHSLTFRGGPVALTIGRPIPTQGLNLKDRAALTAQVREQVAAMRGAPPGTPID